MYLVSFYERQGFVEASLGGRVSAQEIKVFGEELMELLDGYGGQFELLLDHSKAKRLDADAVGALADVKDQCLSRGATRIVSVPIDEQDRLAHESARLQNVLEGSELFVMDGSRYQIAAFATDARPAAIYDLQAVAA